MSLFPFGNFDSWFGGDLPIAQLDTRSTVSPADKIEPAAPVERQQIFTASPGYVYGFDKAPPPSVQLYWHMRRYSAIVLAYAVTTGPILASPRTIEVIGNITGAKRTLADRMRNDAAEDGIVDIVNRAMFAALECLHFCSVLQEVVWDMRNGRKAPIDVRPFLPGEAQIYIDKYRKFSGYQSMYAGPDGYRDARSGFLAVNEPWIDPIAGYSRNNYARVDWWRAVQSGENLDAIERKATLKQLALGVPMGKTFVDKDGKPIIADAMIQTIVNSASTGSAFAFPMCPFTKEDIVRDPALANIPAVRIQMLDWGNTGPAIMAAIARLDALDTRIMRCWRRPEREAMEGTNGTKAEAGTHGQIGVTDSELIADMVLGQFTRQTLRWWSIENYGPEADGLICVKQAPLSDPQEQFRQQYMLARATQGDLEIDSLVDNRRLAEVLELPLRSEADTAAKMQDARDSQAVKDAAAAKVSQAHAQPGGNGGNGGNGDNPPMKIVASADAQSDLVAIASRIAGYFGDDDAKPQADPQK